MKASIIYDIEHGLEIGAEDLLKIVKTVNSKAQAGGPAALAAVGVVAVALDKALGDVQEGMANPTTLVLNFASDVNDIKAVWPAAKELFASVGIKLS